MSRFMDKVLVVAEAEKSSRDIVKRANAELLCRRQRLGDPQQGSLRTRPSGSERKGERR